MLDMNAMPHCPIVLKNMEGLFVDPSDVSLSFIYIGFVKNSLAFDREL